ncbi:type IV pilin protein [Thermodesulfobacteriota bacterium]
MEKFEKNEGFTLIEILVVVILLGILATIIIPQVSVSSDDAKLNAAKTNLANLRNAIELYYYQHSNKFPGALGETSGGATTSDVDAATAFVEQMMKYSSSAGITADSGSSTYQYGPYLRNGIPTNPFNDLDTMICDFDEPDITVKSSSGQDYGWKFYPKTGILVSGDNGAHNSL